MSTLHDPDPEFERRVSALLLDVLIRAGLVLALAMLCFQVFSPFLSLMTWALILAVTLYPLHQSVAAKIGGRQGLAATLLVLLGIVVAVVPTAALMNSLGDSVHRLINDVQNNTLQVPPPREGVAEWPLVGERVHAFWTKAHTDLPALVQSMQPKIGNLAAAALGFVAGIGGGLLQFLASLAVAGIMMAFGEGGARAIRSIFERVADGKRGAEFVDLSTATIRAVAKGVLGVAFLQAIIVGICLLIAGIPWAGVLAVIVLVLGIAQVPALIVTLPAIGYIWSSGNYGTGAAILYTVLLVVSGMADNVLKPLMLGRGVDAPMPVILLGALGGMAAAGILGMFVGATLLALGYQIFMGWVATNPEAPRSIRKAESPRPTESMPAVPPMIFCLHRRQEVQESVSVREKPTPNLLVSCEDRRLGSRLLADSRQLTAATVVSIVLPHVVIIGGGFGGLYAARALRRAPVRVTVLDRRNHHVFQPLLYQVAMAALSPATSRRRSGGFSGASGTSRSCSPRSRAIDAATPSCSCSPTARCRYDYLIVASGATHAYFGHDEWRPIGAGTEDARGRAGDPAPRAAGVRAGRAGARSEPPRSGC